MGFNDIVLPVFSPSRKGRIDFAERSAIETSTIMPKEDIIRYRGEGLLEEWATLPAARLNLNNDADYKDYPLGRLTK